MTQKTQTALKQLRSLFTVSFLPDVWRKKLEMFRSELFQPYFIVVFTLWLVGLVEIIQKIGGQKLEPRFWMLVAILITVYSGVQTFRLTPKLSHMRRRKVPAPISEMVNRMRSNGLTVCENGSNENSGGYVLVTAGGIYAMEVKARNVFGSRTIEYRKQNELVLGGRIADSRPLKQARAAAQKVGERLRGILQAGSVVKPLVVYLNDWQITRPDRPADVPVVNESELQQYLKDQQPILSPAEMDEIGMYLNGTPLAAAC